MKNIFDNLMKVFEIIDKKMNSLNEVKDMIDRGELDEAYQIAYGWDFHEYDILNRQHSKAEKELFESLKDDNSVLAKEAKDLYKRTVKQLNRYSDFIEMYLGNQIAKKALER
jgi:hypothetical protein